MDNLDCSFSAIGICFQPAHASTTAQLFGIADFLATVAIFVVAYSLSDDRYKFRIAISSIPLRHFLFVAIAIGGFALLAVNFWFEIGWPIPRLLNRPIIFQGLIAVGLISVLAFWIHRSFVNPPVFSKRNSLAFAQEVFRSITDGNEEETLAAAREIGRSALYLIEEARKIEHKRNLHGGGFSIVRPKSAEIASEILLLIGDKRFCRVVAQKAPWVAAELFRAASIGGLDELPLAQFSRNVADEFFIDANSAIHHEDDGYRSGLIGYMKPISKTLFGNSQLIDSLAQKGGSPLEMLWLRTGLWSIRSWESYNKAVLLYLADKLRRPRGTRPTTALFQIINGYQHSCNDVYKINTMEDGTYYQSLPFQKLTKAVEFITDTLALLEEHHAASPRRPISHDAHAMRDDLFDLLAELALKLVVSAGQVDTQHFRSWEVQHNVVWSNLMRDYDDSPGRRKFRARLHRLIWREVSDMERMPNYVGARVIAVCLNTMGFQITRGLCRPDPTRALKRVLTKWTRQNYLSLFQQYPDVARSCIGGTITFDIEHLRLVKTYSASLGKEPKREFLVLDAVPTVTCANEDK